MLYGLVIALHVIVCIILILSILLQAGKGGGLNEAFGGSLTQSVFGTKTNEVLTKATTASAIIFICTCVLLGVMTSRRGRSLIDLEGYTPKVMPKAAATAQMPAPTMDQAKKDLPKVAPVTGTVETKAAPVANQTGQATTNAATTSPEKSAK